MAAAALFPQAAEATPDHADGVIVAMGDGYISGTAARWQGNSNDWTLSRNGTDLAWNGYFPIPSDIYGDTNGKCFRSPLGEVAGPKRVAGLGTALPVINIACHGATSENIWRGQTGGKWLQGEQPQSDQLAWVAQNKNVRAITLSIGAGDVGLDRILTDCVNAWVYPLQPRCNGAKRGEFTRSLPAAMEKVDKAVQEIRTVMSAAGYEQNDYSLVLQSYPSPLPNSSEINQPEFGTARTDYGCGMWDADLDWVDKELIPELGRQISMVAASNGADFINMKDALQGHEVCSKGSRQGSYWWDTGDNPVLHDNVSEWARFSNTGLLQGEAKESLYPDFFGQQAMAVCLNKYLQWGDLTPATDPWYCRSSTKKDSREQSFMPPLN
ncbi:hypothetical protein [Streptomyces sp. NPDC057052]|uniref:hypothetical protein n=1 Tax=Streptomyces sp. NPDC057052 TaxID=3346010 RepID=UPI003629D38C